MRSWWRDVWRSPMADQYLEVDRCRLEIIAELRQRFGLAAEAGESLAGLAAEIRLQETAFGLTPMDRTRLHWSIAQGDAAAERTVRRRNTPPDGADPRDMLRLV